MLAAASVGLCTQSRAARAVLLLCIIALGGCYIRNQRASDSRLGLMKGAPARSPRAPHVRRPLETPGISACTVT